MRLKTALFGLLTFVLISILLSSKGGVRSIDRGLNPGELLPNIVVDGRSLTEEIASQEQVTLVVWSSRDAKERLIEAWLTQAMSLQKKGGIYSLCIDRSTADAQYYATLDNVGSDVTLVGLQDEEQKAPIIRALAKKGVSAYHIKYGQVQRVEYSIPLWQEIQGL